MTELREIQAYSNIADYVLDYKKRYWFHQWVDGDTALIEDEQGILIKAKYTEFKFKIDPI